MGNSPDQLVFTPIRKAITNSSPSLRSVRGRADAAADTDFGGSSDEEDEDFRSPTKRMKLATKSTQRSAPLVKLKFPTAHISAPTETLVTLVETPTLKQLGMRYNIKYDMVICVECEAGYMFNSFLSHARNGAKMFSTYDPTLERYVELKPLRKHSRPALKRGPNARIKGDMTRVEVEALVLKELKDLGYNPSPHVAGNPEKDWAPLLPHPDQKGPIDGIRSFPHGFRCAEGPCADFPFPFCSLTDRPMWSHFKRDHPAGTVPSQSHVLRDITLQTLCAVKSSLCYFEVPLGGNEGILGSPVISKQNSLEETLLREQNDLYADLIGDKGLDTDLIDPVYYTAGMVEFWKTFDLVAIRPLQKIKPTHKNRNLPKDETVIAQAVVATFLDISLHAKTGSTAVLNLITNGAPWVYFIHNKRLLVINKIILEFPIHDNCNDSQFPSSQLSLFMLQLKSCFYGS